MKYLLSLSLLILMTSLQACSATGVVAGAAAGTGIAVAKEGGLRRAVSDTVIQAKINELWLRADPEIFTKLDLTVNQGRVLVTGVVQNPEHRVEAIRLAWKPEGVQQVLNEVQVANSTGLTGYARDAWANTRLRTAITLDRDVQSINYSIDVVQGVVYLMGVAQSRAELNRVIETARTIPDIKQVVSYVKLAGPSQNQLLTYQAQQKQAAQSNAPVEIYNHNDVGDRTAGNAAFDSERQAVQREPLY